MYFDFYTKLLHNYAITENVTWAQTIIGASLYEGAAEEDEFE